MALVDRAIVGAEEVVLHSTALIDHVTGATVSTSGSPVQIDPMVSGSNFAYLFDGAASAKSITIPTVSLVQTPAACLEFYLYMRGSSTFTAARLGGENLIEFVSTGLARITLPYATGTTTAMIDFTPDDNYGDPVGNIKIYYTRPPTEEEERLVEEKRDWARIRDIEYAKKLLAKHGVSQ
jgi:hypothetical protein